MVGTGICQTLFSFYCLPCYTFPTQIIKSKSKLVEFGFDVIDGVKLLNAIQQGLIEEMKEMRNKGHIATRIREVKQTQKTEGKFLGGFTCFGLTVVDEKVEKDPAQQAIIKEMKVMRRRGMSLCRISKWVNRTHGVIMSHSTVSTFMR